MTPFEKTWCLSYDRVLDSSTLIEIKRRGYSRIPVYRGEQTNIVGLLLVKQLVDYEPGKKLQTVGEQRLFSVPFVDAGTDVFDMMNAFQEGRSHMAVVVQREEDNPTKEHDGPEGHIKTSGVLSSTRSAPVQPTPSHGTNGTATTSPTPAVNRTRVPVPARILPAEKGAFKSQGPSSAQKPKFPVQTIILDESVRFRASVVVGIVTLEDVVEELIGEEIVDETDEFLDVATGEKVVRKPWNTLKSVLGILSPHLLVPAPNSQPIATNTLDGTTVLDNPQGSSDALLPPTTVDTTATVTSGADAGARSGVRSAAWTGAGVKVLATKEAKDNAAKLVFESHVAATAAALKEHADHPGEHTAIAVRRPPASSPDVGKSVPTGRKLLGTARSILSKGERGRRTSAASEADAEAIGGTGSSSDNLLERDQPSAGSGGSPRSRSVEPKERQ
ncbi:hypothetical protein HDU93_008921 [Gonapodya sp. JEL0774]|nr:hypothetical protein HDU93_008921 [Gonapodya sp. JEL0774]